MTVFTLPTQGAKGYRGKYPTRARSASISPLTGRHIELNNGTRLWSLDTQDGQFGYLGEYGETLAQAVPMTDSQYGALVEAAELSRTRGRFNKPENIDSRVRAMLAAIVFVPAACHASHVIAGPDSDYPGRYCIACGAGVSTLTAEKECEARGPLLKQSRGPDGESILSPVKANMRLQAAGMAQIALRESAARLRATLADFADALESEGNESASELVGDMVRATNTLLDRDAGRLAQRLVGAIIAKESGK